MIGSTFQYLARPDNHESLYTTVSPYGRRGYQLEQKKWRSLHDQEGEGMNLTDLVTPGPARLALSGAYAALSAISFVAYGADKLAAKHGRWRTPETTLHLLALAGGWPGALAAQRVFRHKMSKQPFRSIFRCTVAVNCLGLAWLLVRLS